MNTYTIPVLSRFADAADPSLYAQLPDDWLACLSDVVDSTSAIAAGHYKSVNLAGAATISAVSNALEGDLKLFVFGGDGAGFAIPPEHADKAAEALSRVAAWSQRDLGLELRTGMTRVAAIRKAGHDLRVALWRASDDVRYAMFAGGGMAWLDEQLKAGTIRLPDAADREPDLTGLSCQWGPIRATRGKIVSLIVKRAPGGSDADFADIAEAVIADLEDQASFNPVPESGPQAAVRSEALALQFRVAGRGLLQRISVVGLAAFAWVLFRSGLRLGGFHPDRYRREIASNTDYRKFDDGLLITADCSLETIKRLEATLEAPSLDGRIHYGLHMQDEALMTCIAPSVTASDHMHFVDGAGGGYTAAARQLPT
ncbi:MAG: DUF3095 domain-containing protein [Alphaproteobacteria bacterium]|nr:DUF3095 domain-containing protein [Alphaproteobacteria bacterium]